MWRKVWVSFGFRIDDVIESHPAKYTALGWVQSAIAEKNGEKTTLVDRASSMTAAPAPIWKESGITRTPRRAFLRKVRRSEEGTSSESAALTSAWCLGPNLAAAATIASPRVRSALGPAVRNMVATRAEDALRAETRGATPVARVAEAIVAAIFFSLPSRKREGVCVACKRSQQARVELCLEGSEMRCLVVIHLSCEPHNSQATSFFFVFQRWATWPHENAPICQKIKPITSKNGQNKNFRLWGQTLFCLALPPL